MENDYDWLEYYVVPPGRVTRNTGIFVTRDRWPLESLASRHWIGHRYYARPPTEEERDFAVRAKRHLCVRYETLDQLIEDEGRCVGDAEALKIKEALVLPCRQYGYIDHPR